MERRKTLFVLCVHVGTLLDEEANHTRDQTRNASEATSKAARDFEESYAWVTRKYKPGRQWFEVAFIGYKVVTVSSTRECILFIGAQCV